MAYQEKKVLAETLNKIINDMNHQVPVMKLIDDIPIENPELKNKAGELMDR